MLRRNWLVPSSGSQGSNTDTFSSSIPRICPWCYGKDCGIRPKRAPTLPLTTWITSGEMPDFFEAQFPGKVGTIAEAAS